MEEQCNYNSLQGYELKVLVTQVEKEIWDQMFVLYLAAKKFGVKFMFVPSDVINSEFSSDLELLSPKYYGYEQEELTKFLSLPTWSQIQVSSF